MRGLPDRAFTPSDRNLRSPDARACRPSAWNETLTGSGHRARTPRSIAAIHLEFDVRTALLLGASTTLLLGLMLAVVSRDFAPVLRPALHLWLRANLLLPAGFVLFALRGQIHDLWSVLLGNALIVAAFADYARAIHLLSGRPQPLAAARMAVLLVAAEVAFFTWVMDSLQARIIFPSLVLAALGALAAMPLLRARDTQDRVRRATGLVFVLGSLVMVIRAVHTLLFPESVQHALQGTLVQSLSVATGVLLPLLGSYGFLLLCTDRMHAELERSATLDFLTGIANRGAIEGMGVRAVLRARRRGSDCAAIVVDVDHFKRINDAHGHAVGDHALKLVVQRLRDTLRADDALGRLGGEEFLVLLDDTDATRAMQAAERLRRALGETPLPLEPGPHPTTISLGVAVLSPADRSFGDLLRRADRALYAAKAAGRNRTEMATP